MIGLTVRVMSSCVIQTGWICLVVDAPFVAHRTMCGLCKVVDLAYGGYVIDGATPFCLIAIKKHNISNTNYNKQETDKTVIRPSH